MDGEKEGGGSRQCRALNTSMMTTTRTTTRRTAERIHHRRTNGIVATTSCHNCDECGNHASPKSRMAVNQQQPEQQQEQTEKYGYEYQYCHRKRRRKAKASSLCWLLQSSSSTSLYKWNSRQNHVGFILMVLLLAVPVVFIPSSSFLVAEASFSFVPSPIVLHVLSPVLQQHQQQHKNGFFSRNNNNNNNNNNKHPREFVRPPPLTNQATSKDPFAPTQITTTYNYNYKSKYHLFRSSRRYDDHNDSSAPPLSRNNNPLSLALVFAWAISSARLRNNNYNKSNNNLWSLSPQTPPSPSLPSLPLRPSQDKTTALLLRHSSWYPSSSSEDSSSSSSSSTSLSFNNDTGVAANRHKRHFIIPLFRCQRRRRLQSTRLFQLQQRRQEQASFTSDTSSTATTTTTTSSEHPKEVMASTTNNTPRKVQQQQQQQEQNSHRPRATTRTTLATTKTRTLKPTATAATRNSTENKNSYNSNSTYNNSDNELDDESSTSKQPSSPLSSSSGNTAPSTIPSSDGTSHERRNAVSTPTQPSFPSQMDDTTKTDSFTTDTAVQTARVPKPSTNIHTIPSFLTSSLSTSISSLSTDLSASDWEQIELYWDRLLPTVSYLGTERVAKIFHALTVAYHAHRKQVRKSGEPFIIHPVEVALLLSGLKMDAETIMAGLLHDTVEDTDITFKQLEQLFGFTVRSIVEGETKVSKLPKIAMGEEEGSNNNTTANATTTQHDSKIDEQAENLRQMFVAMSDDYRIIIVKLADRLHNMRTLQFMKPAKQIKISRETLDIFAPLAHRMGIWQFKSELEDISFRYLYPTEYQQLKESLQQHAEQYQEALALSQRVLQRCLWQDPLLRQNATSVEVYGRTKELYSLWHKMKSKNIQDLNDIIDVVGLRVIITPKQQEEEEDNDDDNDDNASSNNNNSEDVNKSNSKEATATWEGTNLKNKGVSLLSRASQQQQKIDKGAVLCYHALGLVHSLPGFEPTRRVKDYISIPKPNGYQSLHTAIQYKGQTIEVQIRTNTMHNVAEYGMASHWAYTDNKRRHSTSSSASNDFHFQTPWLSTIKEWQNDRISSREFVESVRREFLGKRVFVFLRNGKILNLSRGATVIDVAFQIHTEVGLHMHGVEINGRPVPFSYELRNGDVVNILTGKGKPTTDWMRYTTSRSAQSKLRSYFRARLKESLREAGKILLFDYLSTYGELIKERSYFNQNLEDENDADSDDDDHHDKNKKSDSDRTKNVVNKQDKQTWEVPQTEKQLAVFLPGRTRFDNVDDLLIAIGKEHDRMMLHRLVSQLFEVPKRLLIAAEAERQKLERRPVVVTSTLLRQTHHQQQVEEIMHTKNLQDDVTQELALNSADSAAVAGTARKVASTETTVADANSTESNTTVQVQNQNPFGRHALLSQKNERHVADPKHLCEMCLPVYGDAIVGTRPVGNCTNEKRDKNGDSVITVHRLSCPRAQQAIRLALERQEEESSESSKCVSPNITGTNEGSSTKTSEGNKVASDKCIIHPSYLPISPGVVDSVGAKDLKLWDGGRNWNPAIYNNKTPNAASASSRDDTEKVKNETGGLCELIPVHLDWASANDAVTAKDNNASMGYKAEIAITANDRKMLLADCSQIISESVKILKSSSRTILATKDGEENQAVLVFLVCVSGLDCLLTLLERLGNVSSVLSVERRFGSSLLP